MAQMAQARRSAACMMKCLTIRGVSRTDFFFLKSPQSFNKGKLLLLGIFNDNDAHSSSLTMISKTLIQDISTLCILGTASKIRGLVPSILTYQSTSFYHGSSGICMQYDLQGH